MKHHSGNDFCSNPTHLRSEEKECLFQTTLHSGFRNRSFRT